MSLRLILVRHAKSDWADAGLDDIDRPLNKRGRRDAPVMGRWLASQGTKPELALLSPAVRVSETWDLMAPEIGPDVAVHCDPLLYLATPETMLAALAGRAETEILLVGHNPGLASLAQWLVTDTPDRTAFHRFPTGATLVLGIHRTGWSALDERCAEVEAFAVPRDFEGSVPEDL